MKDGPRYTLDRCPMAASGPADSAAAPSARWPRAPVAGGPRGPRWEPLGAADWGPRAGSARPLSAVPTLPSPLSTVGTSRRPTPGAQHARRGPPATRCPQSRRGLHRRNLPHSAKGGLGGGPTKRGNGPQLLAIADRGGRPIAVPAASPHELTLGPAVLAQTVTAVAPQRVIGDKASDSDPLDAVLREPGIARIAPHKANRRHPPTQDGRVWRRYRRRWKSERLFAWGQGFRRIATRHEYDLDNFRGCVHLGCLLILLRGYLGDWL